jgi:hypothetical protein
VQADANIAAIRGRNADAEERRRAKTEKEEYDRLRLLPPICCFLFAFCAFRTRSYRRLELYTMHYHTPVTFTSGPNSQPKSCVQSAILKQIP